MNLNKKGYMHGNFCILEDTVVITLIHTFFYFICIEGILQFTFEREMSRFKGSLASCAVPYVCFIFRHVDNLHKLKDSMVY